MQAHQINRVKAARDLADKVHRLLGYIPRPARWLLLRVWGVDIKEARADCYFICHHLRHALGDEKEGA